VNHLERVRIMDDLETRFIEWREDLGLSSEQILITQLANARDEIEQLKKQLARAYNATH
jgi:hypothetical protein